jgi:hypothetical protein
MFNSGINRSCSNGNRNLIMIYLQVTNPTGNPVTGLGITAFDVRDISAFNNIQIIPQTSCANCFVDLGAGSYRLAVEPIPAASPWRTGKSVFRVIV